MSGKDQGLRLNLISTYWSVVNQAHGSRAEAARSARGQLLERYEGAVRRYLRGALRDEDAAADLFQEFALCLVRGDLRGADPCRGRFRDYVKGVLSLPVGKEALDLRGHTPPVLSLALSSDGKRLFSGSADSTIKVWDLAAGKGMSSGTTSPAANRSFPEAQGRGATCSARRPAWRRCCRPASRGS